MNAPWKKLSFIVILFICYGCTEDFGTNTVTYTKATANYGDLDAIRQIPLKEENREIVNPGKIYVTADLLLIGEEGEGIHMFSNSDPRNPRPIMFINIPNNREFYVNGDYLYAESTYDMLKIDISNRSEPQIVSRVNGAFGDILRNGEGEALIGFTYETITEQVEFDEDVYQRITNGDPLYFDYANRMIPPSAVPTSFAGNTGSSIGTVNRIAYSKEHVYVINHSNMTIFDDANGFEKVYQESIGFQMETIYPLGDRIFIGAQSNMDVYNISDPANPQYESGFWHQNSCDPVYPINESTAYLTLRTGDFAECPGDENALMVLDISHPGEVWMVQEVTMESPYGMTLIDDFLYVGEGEAGLKIFDASDRRNIKLLEHNKSVTAYDIIPHPTIDRMVLIAGPAGFTQFSVGISHDEMSELSTINF